MTKILLVISSILLSINLNASCDNVYLDENGGFNEDYKMITMYKGNNIPITELSQSVQKRPKNCSIMNKNLFMYLYRNDMQNTLLIQFIFSSSNNGFQKFSDKLINSYEFKNAIENINTDKDNIILEIKNMNHLEIQYKIVNGEIINK